VRPEHLDRPGAFAGEHGRFSSHSQHADLVTVLTQAREYYYGVTGAAVG
jgi:hypothetical protein